MIDLMPVALYLFPLFATGAIQRMGEMGTELAVAESGQLVEAVRRRRRAEGRLEEPATAEELQDDLAALGPQEQAAIHRLAGSTVIIHGNQNTVNGDVSGVVNFGNISGTRPENW